MKYRKIESLRKNKNLYQRDIAKLINTTQQHYSRIENGETEITSDRLIKLANFYDTSIDYIVGLTDEKKPYPRTTKKDYK